MKFANPSKKTKQIATLSGHVLHFPGKGTLAKGDLTEDQAKHWAIDKDGHVFVPVPPSCVADVRAVNMIPDEEFTEVDEPLSPKRPEDVDAFQKQVFDVMRRMTKDAKRSDFGANGVPKAEALQAALGYELNNAEVKDLWVKYQAVGND